MKEVDDMKVLMSGNEAIARGAYEYGVEVATGYPGTPSSEILENIVQYKEIYSEWSVNEKVAMDAAIGASYAGRRAMVTMKQVGMNVASDSFFYDYQGFIDQPTDYRPSQESNDFQQPSGFLEVDPEFIR